MLRAMEILRRNKLLFGISCCYTRRNTEIIGSEAYIDAMIDMGAKFAWFFTYMPVGQDAATELLATAEQREFMYRKIRAYRSTKPLFMAYHDGQPFNKNHLRPCPVLDNPGALTKMVDKTRAYSTDLLHPEPAKAYSDRCVDVAARWAPVADRLWEENHPCADRCGNCKKE